MLLCVFYSLEKTARIHSLESELQHIGVNDADKQIECTQLKENINHLQQKLQEEAQKVESKYR